MKSGRAMIALLRVSATMLGIGAVDARAAELRDFCPDRPGLNTPPCTIDRGHADLELGLLDWTRDRQAGIRTDSAMVSEITLRYGLDDHLEVQLGWDGVGFQSVRPGTDKRRYGSGDLRIALRQNLRNPDGSGLSVAIMPFATLPVGSGPFGGSDWTSGVIVPISYELPHGVQLAFTAEADAAANAEDSGHHLSFGGTIGLALPLSKAITTALEFQHSRDEDPAGTSDQSLAGISMAWMRSESLQFDSGAVFGLTRDAPDLEIYAGLSRRF